MSFPTLPLLNVLASLTRYQAGDKVMGREAAASFQLSGKEKPRLLQKPCIKSWGDVYCNALMAMPQCLDGLGWCIKEGTKKEPCLLIPGTELLGGKQILLTT